MCSLDLSSIVVFFFFKQNTAYELRISDWSSDVCSSDLPDELRHAETPLRELLTAKLGRGKIEVRASYTRTGGAELAKLDPAWLQQLAEIGRASCRERVGQYLSISVVGLAFKQTTTSTSK